MHIKTGFEEKPTLVDLAQENGFSQQSCAPAREDVTNECNKYDLTAASCFWLANHNDWSRWFAIT